MKNELIIGGKKREIEVIFTKNEMDDILSKLEEEAKGFVGDVTTASGRKNIISFARKFTTTKTLIDSAGKDHVARLKAQPKKIDAERKRLRDKCDKLRDEVRYPVTQWEKVRKLVDESIGRIKVFTTSCAANSCLIDSDIKKLIDIDTSTVVEDKLDEYELAIESALAAQYIFFATVSQEEIDKAEFDRLQKEESDRKAKEKEDERIRKAEEAATVKANKKNENKILQAKLDKEKAEKELLEVKAGVGEVVKEAVRDAVEKKTEAPAVNEEPRAPLPRAKPQTERISCLSTVTTSGEESTIKAKIKIRQALQSAGLNFGQAQVAMEAIVSGKIPYVTVTY